ncbi:conserved hypothetical protein [Pediculus humanus corporis]|uniref:Uncharacterized protein n=1 Tax=Pediculus humanus subsp. corporis TaxID=121224 RepID=E0VI90_PEDHC|nr:uncharacterized protein Phum_PHUM221900 [Pediculus humanus corporis]EEB13096.1 conserved hypothetical protein [Pediculus humanus corporis]
MPHVNSGGGGDDFSNDEVKVFKDEGEVEKNSSENLKEEKSDLIDLTESECLSSFLLLIRSYYYHRLLLLLLSLFVCRSGGKCDKNK